ncbi:MAG: hypothetical protein U0353_29335 [Sandaracinus sp.]
MSRRAVGLVASLLALLALGLVPLVARAGDRPFELLLVNMAPASAQPDCMRDVTRILRHEDATIHRMGGDRVRELAGHEDDGSDFRTWRAEDLDAAVRVVRTETPIDAVVLVDCRGDEGRADTWVRGPSGGVARLRLRRTVIDTERAEWLARMIVMQMWVGFSP